MNRPEFEELLKVDLEFAKPIQKAAEAGQAKQFGVVSEAVMVALMFPIVMYVVRHVGLP